MVETGHTKNTEGEQGASPDAQERIHPQHKLGPLGWDHRSCSPKVLNRLRGKAALYKAQVTVRHSMLTGSQEALEPTV